MKIKTALEVYQLKTLYNNYERLSISFRVDESEWVHIVTKIQSYLILGDKMLWIVFTGDFEVNACLKMECLSTILLYTKGILSRVLILVNTILKVN